MKPPKFKLNQTVKCKPTLYGETKGVVYRIEKVYARVDDNGNFIRGGLHTTESSIENISLPYEFDGETLKVHYPEYDYGNFIEKVVTRVSKLKEYAYSVRTPKMNTLFSESQLKAL
jgi:hypothetical protein